MRGFETSTKPRNPKNNFRKASVATPEIWDHTIGVGGGAWGLWPGIIYWMAKASLRMATWSVNTMMPLPPLSGQMDKSMCLRVVTTTTPHSVSSQDSVCHDLSQLHEQSGLTRTAYFLICSSFAFYNVIRFWYRQIVPNYVPRPGSCTFPTVEQPRFS